MTSGSLKHGRRTSSGKRGNSWYRNSGVDLDSSASRESQGRLGRAVPRHQRGAPATSSMGACGRRHFDRNPSQLVRRKTARDAAYHRDAIVRIVASHTVEDGPC